MKEATRMSITKVLCCIETADQEKQSQFLPGEAGRDSIFVSIPCHNAWNNKNSALPVSLSSSDLQVGRVLDVTSLNVSFKILWRRFTLRGWDF